MWYKVKNHCVENTFIQLLLEFVFFFLLSPWKENYWIYDEEIGRICFKSIEIEISTRSNTSVKERLCISSISFNLNKDFNGFPHISGLIYVLWSGISVLVLNVMVSMAWCSITSSNVNCVFIVIETGNIDTLLRMLWQIYVKLTVTK